jgi:type II secretory pathway pseudopilin PulG
MAALLVALSVMAVLMTVAMPVWKQMSTREKEEELVFRGEQYARAIGLFQRKFANAAPPNIDVLVEQRFLRKKYKDPITNDDFVPMLQGQPTAPGAMPNGGRGAATPGAQSPSTGAAPSPSTGTTPSGTLGGSPTTAGTPLGAAGRPLGATGAPLGASGGLIGVTSKSKDKSIRIYKGHSHYNEWQFVYTQPTAAPGTGAPGGAPGVPGGQRGQGQRSGGAAQPNSPGPSGMPSPTVPGRGGRGGR